MSHSRVPQPMSHSRVQQPMSHSRCPHSRCPTAESHKPMSHSRTTNYQLSTINYQLVNVFLREPQHLGRLFGFRLLFPDASILQELLGGLAILPERRPPKVKPDFRVVDL